VKSLAEFIMRGRLQAMLVAVVASASLLFCWLGAAAVALVTLRQGASEGLRLLLWALLPALVTVSLIGDTSYVALLCGTTAMALVLQITVNLPLTLLCSVLVGAASGALMLGFGEAYLDQVSSALIEPYLAYVEQQQAAAGRSVTLTRPSAATIAGLVGTGTATLAVLCLLLGRYWQAALYHPGGFGEEFRALRYPLWVSAALVALVLVMSGIGDQWRAWVMVCLVPLSFAGLGLVHARARLKSWGTGRLALFYVAWLLIGPVQVAVMLLAVADSGLDFRHRWAAPPGPPRDDGHDS